MSIFKSARIFLAATALLFGLGASAAENVLWTDYAPNGSSFSQTVMVDWTTQEVYAQIDLTNCTGISENVLSVGKDISVWKSEGYHLYYTSSQNSLGVNYVGPVVNNPVRLNLSISGTIEVIVNKEKGITVNGEQVGTTTSTSGLFALTSIGIGSLEGATRSNAKYLKVSVRDIEKTVDPDPAPGPDEPGSLSPTATDKVYDFSGFSDTALLTLFKKVLDDGRKYPTLAEFQEIGIQESDIAFIRSHVRNKGILSRADRLVAKTYQDRDLWMNIPMGVGSDGTGGQPTGTFSSDVFSVWNYTNLFGSWNHGLFTAPASWTDAAHKNGTDIMSGIKFFDTTGGSTAGAGSWVNFIKQHVGDKYDYAEPLINLLMYFGFDGINYNWEASGYDDDDVVNFHKQLYKIADERGFNNFHSGIYTSSSSLSDYNVNALFGNEKGRSHDLMLNYASGDFAYRLNTTAKKAESALSTTKGLYAGVWIVSMDRNWQRLDADDDAHKVSVCLWGEHGQSRFWSYNYGNDSYSRQTNYQKLLERTVSGGNRNPLSRPAVSSTGNNWEVGSDGKEPLSTFAGLAEWIPERTAIHGNLPFATGFQLGNGDRYSYKGKRTTGEWYNMGTQDIVPTYRWLVVQPDTKTVSTDIQPEFTSLDQYTGGTSLLLTGKATSTGTDVVLYKTELNVSVGNPYAKIAVKNGKDGINPSNLYLILQKKDGSWVETPYGDVSGNTWEEKKLNVNGIDMGDEITGIGLRVKGSDDNYKLYVGKLEVNDDVKATPANVKDLKCEVKQETKTSLSAKLWWNTTATALDRADYDLVYNDEANIDHFEILYKNGEDGKVSEIGRTTTWSTFVPNIELAETDDNPFIGVRAASTDLKTYSPVEWINIPRAAQDLLPARKDDSYGTSQIDPNAEGYAIAIQQRYVTDVTTQGADKDLDFTNGGPVEDGTNYRDATDHVLEVHQGQTFTLHVKSNEASDGMRYCFGRAWIDLNGNKQFEPNTIEDDPENGECLFTVGTLRAATPAIENPGIDVSVTIPENATPGDSRMRIVFADAWFAGTLLPTGLTSKGFTIDLGVKITGTNPGRTVSDSHDQGAAEEPEQLTGNTTGVNTVSGQVSTVAVSDGTLNFQNADKAWIYDLTGATRNYLVKPTSVSIASLPKGVYLVKMQSGNIFRSQKVVIK